MRAYFFRTIGAALVCLMLHFAAILFGHGPIQAEYWARELIVIKQKLAENIAAPKLIFLGGSSTLFGIDASQVAREMKVPALNLGLHAGLRLDDILAAGRSAARARDTIVLLLEPPFYTCAGNDWTGWQLRNTIAWNKAKFDALPLADRVRAAISGGGATLGVEIVASAVGARLFPSRFQKRLDSLAAPDVIWDNYQSRRLRSDVFAYSAYNIDPVGDMEGALGSRFQGAGTPAVEPMGICPLVIEELKDFVTEMEGLQVAVIFGHTPYLVDRGPERNWEEAEAKFAAAIAAAGARLIDRRDALFMTRDRFFNTGLHLNTLGRQERTASLIADLKQAGIAPVASASP